MQPFSFDHLDETQFEEFCYDLLGEVGFINRNWRKGTGLSSSPSDRGRDIECEREMTEPVGNKYLEKWFVECKHYKKGVPPEKLQGLLAWANAERPNHVLIIASNFFSNPAKDYIESYNTNNNPPFRIHIWERPELEKLVVGKSGLLRKYGIGGEFPFLSILHPIHLVYLRRGPLNSLDYFFNVLDKLDSEKRDSVLSWVNYAIIKPRMRKPVSGKETLKELLIDEVSYDVFKAKCRDIIQVMDQHLFVFGLVSFILERQFLIGDLTNMDTVIERHESDIAGFQNLLRGLDADSGEAKDNLDLYLEIAKGRDLTFSEEGLRETLEAIIARLTESLKDVENRTRGNYSLYVSFCENVLSELLKESIFLNL